MEYSFLSKPLYYRYILDNSLSEFYVIVVGYEQCKKDKEMIGPLMRSHYVLHYCISGKGYFTLDGKNYTVGPNDIFFIPSNCKVSYQQDKENPWTYLWVEANGSSVKNIFHRAGFTLQTPIVHNEDKKVKDILYSLLEDLHVTDNDLFAISKTLMFFHRLIVQGEKNKKLVPLNERDLITKITIYINNNYMKSTFSAKNIALYFHLNQSYLSRLFKAKTGFTLTKYIYDIRMQKARLLLLSGKLNVQEVAYSVGYSDPLYFSKVFKRYAYINPSKYKKKVE